MQKVQVDAVERNAELRKGVQRGFLGAPVKPVAPVFHQLTKISDIGAIGPGLAGRLIGKARAMEMFVTGRRVEARDAREVGLIREIVSAQRLIEAAIEIARLRS